MTKKAGVKGGGGPRKSLTAHRESVGRGVVGRLSSPSATSCVDKGLDTALV